jgi:hypothetical protein
MHEVDEELREIKREIIESRGLVIKTNNLTNALSADVKSIAKRQQTYERRLSWNSATAYVVFVLVVFAALKLAWDARVDQIKAETQDRTGENERLKKDLKEAQRREDGRSRAETRAAQFYDLARQGKKAELVEHWESVKKEPLTKAEQAAFADVVERARGDLVPAGRRQDPRPEVAGGGDRVRGLAPVQGRLGPREQREAQAGGRVPAHQQAGAGGRHPDAALRDGAGSRDPGRRALHAGQLPDGSPGVERRQEHVANALAQVPGFALRAGGEAAARAAPALALKAGCGQATSVW